MEEIKKNKIISSFESSLDCYQRAIYSICKRKYNRDVMLICALFWEVNLKKNTGVLWCDINIPEPNIIVHIMKEWYGIEMKYNILSNKAATEKICQGLFNNEELVIQMDGFDCSWNFAYQKHHLPHTLIIKNYCHETDMYQCYDPFYQENYIYEILAKKVENSVYSVTEIREISQEKRFDISEIYKILSNNYGGTIDEIEQFYKNIINRIKQIKEIDELFYGENEPELSDLILKCKNIANNRNAICGLLLTYENKKSKNSFDLAEYFYELGNVWRTININFMRMNLKQCIECSKVYEKLEEAKKIEVLIMEQLSEYKKTEV